MEKPGTVAYWLFLILALFTGVIMVVLAAYFTTTEHQKAEASIIREVEKVRPDLLVSDEDKIHDALAKQPMELVAVTVLRDLGIALTVAIILTIVIETYARTRFQDEIRRGIIEAAFKRVIPSPIFDEVRDNVIRANIIKRDWDLQMTLYESDSLKQPIDAGLYVSRTIVSYKLCNISASRITHDFNSILDIDIEGKDEGGKLPRFERVTVGSESFDGVALEAILSENKCSYSLPRLLAANESVNVVNEIREIIRIPDTFVWSMTAQTEDARISIDSAGLSDVAFEVTALHPDRHRIRETVRGGVWNFPGGIIAWQGFQIRTYRLPGKPTACG